MYHLRIPPCSAELYDPRSVFVSQCNQAHRQSLAVPVPFCPGCCAEHAACGVVYMLQCLLLTGNLQPSSSSRAGLCKCQDHGHAACMCRWQIYCLCSPCDEAHHADPCAALCCSAWAGFRCQPRHALELHGDMQGDTLIAWLPDRRLQCPPNQGRVFHAAVLQRRPAGLCMMWSDAHRNTSRTINQFFAEHSRAQSHECGSSYSSSCSSALKMTPKHARDGSCIT